MTARRFDPEKNRQEINVLYGPKQQIDWDHVVLQATVRSPDNRDLRDPEKLGQKILRKVARRRVAPENQEVRRGK